MLPMFPRHAPELFIIILLRNKIDRKRMTFKGYANTKPIHPIPEKNAEEEDENRRVEILIEDLVNLKIDGEEHGKICISANLLLSAIFVIDNLLFAAHN